MSEDSSNTNNGAPNGLTPQEQMQLRIAELNAETERLRAENLEREQRDLAARRTNDYSPLDHGQQLQYALRESGLRWAAPKDDISAMFGQQLDIHYDLKGGPTAVNPATGKRGSLVDALQVLAVQNRFLTDPISLQEVIDKNPHLATGRDQFSTQKAKMNAIDVLGEDGWANLPSKSPRVLGAPMTQKDVWNLPRDRKMALMTEHGLDFDHYVASLPRN